MCQPFSIHGAWDLSSSHTSSQAGTSAKKKKNRYAFIIPIVCLTLAFTLPLLLDQRITEHSALSVALNAGPMLAIMLLGWALSGRAWVGLLLESIVLAFIHLSSAQKIKFLGIDLLYADAMTVRSIIDTPAIVLGFVPATMWIAIGVALIVLIALVFKLWPYGRSTPPIRIGLLLLSCSVLGCVSLARAPNTIPSLGWEVFDQSNGGKRAGIVGNLILGKMTANDVRRMPDTQKISRFWNEDAVAAPALSHTALADEERPDIVIIQSESLFDLRKLNGFDVQVLPTLYNAEPGRFAELEVPVYGGRTLQTEFEVLSGVPISYYNNSMFIYFEIFNKPMSGLPANLQKYGYATRAIHPARRSFWRRDKALPYLGFDVFVDESSFIRPHEKSTRGLVTDLALMRSVVSTLDAATGPTMVTGITIENHGPWGKQESDLELPETVSAQLDEQGRRQLADYIQRSQAADASLNYLLRSLQARPRKTVVIFYGDHLPALPAVFNTLGFRNGLKANQQTTPIRVWANYDIPDLPPQLPSYLVSGWLMDAIGLDKKNHFQAAALAVRQLHPTAPDPMHTAPMLERYAHVAAAGLEHDPELESSRRLVLLRENIDLELSPRLHPIATQAAPKIDGRYLRFATDKPGAQAIRMDVRGIDQVLLRAAYSPQDVGCGLGQAPQQAQWSVAADNTLIYSAQAPGYSFRLLTIDTRQVSELVISKEVSTPNGACNEFLVKTTQLQCNGNCSIAKQPPQPPMPQPLTRIMSGDHLDIELEVATPSLETSGDDAASRLLYMLSKSGLKHEAFGSFQPVGDGRLKMHPGQNEVSWLDFDVSGLEEVEISGQIEPLYGECHNINEPGKENGVVGLTFSIDDQAIGERVIVDQNNRHSERIRTDGARNLRVIVDKGNEVDWCDHFSIGIDRLKERQKG